jgi:hypothetical protein
VTISRFRTTVVLLVRPDALADAAARTSATTSAAWATFTWPLLMILPVIGGGVAEPYPNWDEYLWDTLSFAPFWGACSLTVSVPLAWLMAMYSRGQDAQSIMRRALLLSAVPVTLPALVLLPFRVIARSYGQVFLNPPPFPSGIRYLGSSWLLLALVVAWFVSFVHAVRTIRRREIWAGTGCCTRCGYSLEGLGSCPECGADAAAANPGGAA